MRYLPFSSFLSSTPKTLAARCESNVAGPNFVARKLIRLIRRQKKSADAIHPIRLIRRPQKPWRLGVRQNECRLNCGNHEGVAVDSTCSQNCVSCWRRSRAFLEALWWDSFLL